MQRISVNKEWTHINDILQVAMLHKASDLHVTVELPPVLRMDGKLVAVGEKAFSRDEIKKLIMDLAGEARFRKFEEMKELDFSYSVAGFGRFRVNIFHQRGSMGIATRIIPFNIPSLEELGMPAIVRELTKLERGLVIVTGPTGSGKSTTLAAMIDLINTSRSSHIITLEDPIEYLHRHKQSIVNQREIGLDSPSFANGLRAALRQDPDVVLVGEMRDLETIGTAVTAAETGHLVLASLHTSDAPGTIDRIIDVFPPHQQQQIRVQLSSTLQGVIAQQLIPMMDKPGRIAAVEVLTVNAAVRNLIREQKTHQIYSVMQTSSKLGMQTMDTALKELYLQHKISKDEVQKKALDSENILRTLNGYGK